MTFRGWARTYKESAILSAEVRQGPLKRLSRPHVVFIGLVYGIPAMSSKRMRDHKRQIRNPPPPTFTTSIAVDFPTEERITKFGGFLSLGSLTPSYDSEEVSLIDHRRWAQN